jgi:Uma2 family endonuclease
MALNLTGLVPPISLRPAATLTDEELMRFSEENKPYKIERNRGGRILMGPGGIESIRAAHVGCALFAWNDRVGAGIAFGWNAGFKLRDGSCLSPDAAWLSLGRWNALTLEEQAGFPPLCPEFVVEVRSQSDARRAVESKMGLWLENGAELAWLVDPIDKNVTVYRPVGGVEVLERPGVVRGVEPVAGFELSCSRLWG